MQKHFVNAKNFGNFEKKATFANALFSVYQNAFEIHYKMHLKHIVNAIPMDPN